MEQAEVVVVGMGSGGEDVAGRLAEAGFDVIGDATLAGGPASLARRVRPSARTVLAVLLLAMAAGQLSDVGGFARILATYRVFPSGLLTPVAWMVAGVEAMAGVLLLGARRCGGWWALLVAVAWAALGLQAFARGLPVHNCGCFGVHLGQPLRWWVLLEDAEFVALAAWVRASRPVPARPSDGKRSPVSCWPRRRGPQGHDAWGQRAAS